MTPALKPVEELRWVASAVLEALAERGKKCGDTFTSADLLAWVPELAAGTKRTNATTRLTGLGLLTYRQWMDETGDLVGTYMITAAGAEAIRGVQGGKAHKSGPKRPHGNRPQSANAFSTQLWRLVRARRLLDAKEAAETLVDAGDDVKKAEQHASKLFRRWELTGHLAASAQRVHRVGTSNGHKRYVLINDCGPMPPQSPSKKTA